MIELLRSSLRWAERCFPSRGAFGAQGRDVLLRCPCEFTQLVVVRQAKPCSSARSPLAWAKNNLLALLTVLLPPVMFNAFCPTALL